MSKHTPGPWYVSTEYPIQVMKHMEHLVGKTAFTDYVVADISEGAFAGEEELANARLIAAAPEMFDMLHKAREAFARKLSGDYGAELLQDFCSDIDDLLNKVRGE